MWYWIVGAVLVLVAAAGMWFEIGNRLGRWSEKSQGQDPQLAEDLRNIRRDIERGRDGWGAF